MNKIIYKHVIKLLKLLFITILVSGCFEKDEYESLKKHDKNNNKIIDEFEKYINEEVNDSDYVSQDLRKVLFLFAKNFYNTINEKKLDKKKAYYYKEKFINYFYCVKYIVSKNKSLTKHEFISEFGNFDGSKLLPFLVVNKQIYKKYAIYNGLLHGRVGGPRQVTCNIELKASYD